MCRWEQSCRSEILDTDTPFHNSSLLTLKYWIQIQANEEQYQKFLVVDCRGRRLWWWCVMMSSSWCNVTVAGHKTQHTWSQPGSDAWHQLVRPLTLMPSHNYWTHITEYNWERHQLWMLINLWSLLQYSTHLNKPTLSTSNRSCNSVSQV